MKLALVLAASVLSTAAFAQTTTVIERDRPSTTVIEKRENPTVIEKRSTTVESTGSVGCSSTETKRTDVTGDTTTKKQVEC